MKYIKERVPTFYNNIRPLKMKSNRRNFVYNYDKITERSNKYERNNILKSYDYDYCYNEMLGLANKLEKKLNRIEGEFNKNNLNQTQEIYNYNNYHLEENNPIIKLNKSFDIFKKNPKYEFLNYDHAFHSEENNFDINNEEDNDDDNYDKINAKEENNNNYYNIEENSMLGHYDNFFLDNNNKNNELSNIIIKNNYEIENINDIINQPINIDNQENDNNNEKIFKNKFNENIGITSKELTLQKKKEKKSEDFLENFGAKYNLGYIKENESNKEKGNEKRGDMINDDLKKELQNYDLIIEQARELNNEFNEPEEQDKKEINIEMGENNQNEKIDFEEKENKLQEKKEDSKEEPLNLIEQEYKKENIEIIDKGKNDDDLKKKKSVNFDENTIYIKYNQDDLVKKIFIFNQKNDRLKKKKHNIENYFQKLRNNEKLKPVIINCPKINIFQVNKKIKGEIKNDDKTTRVKSEKKNKKITQSSIKTNKTENKKTITEDTKGKNNIKDTKKTSHIKAKINKNNIVKEKEKLEKEEKNDQKISIFSDPKFLERQKAINNLKKFFEENNFDENVE